jgi:hypothetical protein
VNRTDEKPRNLSRHQYGSLKFIAENKVSLAYLRNFHANTLGSIAYWGWIVVNGNSDDSIVSLTPLGEHELKSYQQASFNERSHESDLTDRCQRLLKHARRLRVMQKAF